MEIEPFVRARWLHDFCRSGEAIEADLAGTGFVAQGMEPGRHVAVLGVGVAAVRAHPRPPDRPHRHRRSAPALVSR